ncbi:YceI family protein [Paraburkholderia lycopersici]|uniref:Polyisoprenoid-binding protein YceI n=1 Tax=Paraburkholderia lycopersici TaxID=416944 RepID=A0A1G6KE36_9BURK|nr:YceI family protein [Paraburkholderia lycopersici]SDC29223.1 Polyisoprenoid-binding protein YceI [Paraburkholderia lycopersici]
MIQRLAHAASVVALAAGAAAFVTNADAAAEAAKNSVTAVFKQMNVPVEGRFNHFTANVRFDPANVAASSAKLDVDVASFDIGAPEYNKEVAGDEWFDAAHFPHATFVSTQIKPGANGAFSVTGKLTIKGKTTDVVVPVQYHKDGANQVFDGTLPIKRLAYNIGSGEWKDTSVVADDVQIKFHIVSAAH